MGPKTGRFSKFVTCIRYVVRYRDVLYVNIFSYLSGVTRISFSPTVSFKYSLQKSGETVGLAYYTKNNDLLFVTHGRLPVLQCT